MVKLVELRGSVDDRSDEGLIVPHEPLFNHYPHLALIAAI
jgi:hypothetical protein